MYYVKNNHEAIIDRETFEKVQQEIERRAIKHHPNPQPKQQYPFTRFVRCGYCGKYYQRKITAAGTKYAKAVWICFTFNAHGKSVCPSQQIPENILIDKTLEMLGLRQLDAAAIRKSITEIQVPEHNKLIYIFKNGHTEEMNWQNPSRRKSWSEEMKQKARERQLANLERRRKNE